MARRTLIDIDNRIIDAVIQIGSEEGIKNVTSNKVAKLCGISHFTCFEHFGTRQGMLDTAAERIEDEFLKDLEELIDNVKDVVKVWNIIIDRFLIKSKKPLYYWYYHKENKYELTLKSEKEMFYLNYAKRVFPNSNANTDLEYMLLWDHMIEMMFYYTEKIINGLIPNTIESRNYISKIVFEGII